MSLSLEDSVSPVEAQNRQTSTDLLTEFFDLL